MRPEKTIVRETITPKVAERYLNMYAGNRKIVDTNVAYFASLIRAGRFRLTHQGIAFHVDGHLADGQHRLWAIIETGIAVEMFVARGLLDEDVLAIDNGRTRDLKDAAHYAGIEADAMAFSITKILAQGVTSDQRKVPAELVFEWYAFYKDGIDFAIKLRSECQPLKKKMTAPMAAAFARAYYGVDKEEMLESMAEVIKTGQLASIADRAALTLRDAWMTGRLGARKDQYFKTCAAIRAFVDRRPIKTLQRAEMEVWPIQPLPTDIKYTAHDTRNSPRAGKAAQSKFLAKHGVAA